MYSSNKSASAIQEQLESGSGKKLHLKINDNRSTMLSVKWEPDCTKVSLHRMFLQAPKNIMRDLAFYLRGDNLQMAPALKAYMNEKIQTLDYSHKIDLDSLETLGEVYDLQEIYNDINEEYFDGRLNLYICWFGKAKKRYRTRVTLGLYHDPMKLIKINRLLDKPRFPDYLIAFIIYHEMLHYVCPPTVDAKGVKHVHTKAFREQEKRFRYYAKAQQWMKEHREEYF